MANVPVLPHAAPLSNYVMLRTSDWPVARMQSDNRMKLSWTCEEQLFQQELESADDIRLSVRLFSKCMPDKRKVGQEPG